MRHFAVLIGLAACILIGAGSSALAEVQSGNKVTLHPLGPVPGSYIVVFEDDVTNVPAQARRLTRGTGVRLTHVYQFALKGFAGRMTAAQANALSNEPDVAYVEQDVYATTAGHFGTEEMPTGVDRIDADENTTAMTDGGYTFSVAVLDTGIDFEHPDLNVNTGLSVTCIEGSPIFPSCRSGGDDDHLHGSHVAGTIGAKSGNAEGVVGVAAGIDLVAVKVLDSNGSGRASQLITGIDYVTANAPLNGGQIAVANMSLEFRQHVQAVCDAITNSANAGVVHVAAAGNEGKSLSGNNSPGDCPDVISVSALSDYDGQDGGIGTITCRTDEDDSFANFSNYGPDVHIMAPGVCIHSTYPTDLFNPPYGTISGTSMAAPHVAGAAALYIHSSFDGLPKNDVQAKSIRDKIISLGKAQTDSLYGLVEFDDPDGCSSDGSGTNCEPILYVNSADFGGGGEVNSAPVVTITDPADGSLFDNATEIAFSGSAEDEEDDTNPLLDWSSSIDGALAKGLNNFSTKLSVGTHTITAEAMDSGGKTGSASVTVDVCDASTPAPSVTITEPADGDSFTEGETITFTGSATDCPDGDLTAALAWEANDGSSVFSIGTGGSFGTTLDPGTYTITASVTDSDSNTGTATVTDITVQAGSTATSFHASIVYSSEGGRNSDKHLNSEVTITDDIDSPVSGATVDATVVNTVTTESMSGIGTTDSTGLVIFSWKNAPSGCYDTIVNSVNGNTSVDETDAGHCKE